MNLAQNIERSQRIFPDKPALIFEGKYFTYRELNEMTNRVANGLSELGISGGDRVALFMPNIPPFVAAYLGIQKIGAVPVSINSALKAEEAKFILDDCGATILVTTEILRANIPTGEISQLKHILIAEGEAKADMALSELMANAELTALAIDMDPDDPAAILYTSGTTGFPKGATLSHSNLVSNIRTFVDTVGTHPDDRILLFLPASHSYGQTSTLFPCLEVGATLVLHRELEIEGILKSIVDNGVTTFFGVSTIYTLLYEKASAEQMRTIRRYVSGGAPLPLELAKKWREKFGVSINEEYGSTETSLICFNQTYQPCSVGSVLEGVKVKLIDSETGQEVKQGELGEVVVRGPNVMLGYWNRPTETAQVLKEGWFHTGDIGRADEEGYLYLVDRIKDMINVGGLKVYPSEVENMLYQHPAVAEVAVYGVPEPLLGEQVIASIIPKSGVAVTAKEIVAFCRQNMADFKVPNLIELVDSLPKGRTGKILKKILREQWKPRSGDESSSQKSPESLKQWLSDWLETELALDPETIETDRAFADYGLNSTLAVVLAQDLSEWLEQPIEPIVTWNFPTIEQIIAHLLPEQPTAESSETSSIRAETKITETQPEPIAIIGIGCRFPGGANTPAQFWELLHNGVDTVTDIPNSRWDVDAYYDPNPNQPGKMYIRAGSFLEGIDQFDPQFFGIAPLEAASLDPQQRLILEVSWEALEHAGIAPAQLRESLTGVFIGSFWDDYSALHLYADDPSQIDVYRTLSNLRGLAAGRIAYVLGLQGPSMQLDTTCSSSLLAVHLACQSLRGKECHLALAGGVALNLSPELAIGLCSMTALAPDGRCKTFDAKADGFGLGEGCGMVILKRFSDAIRDGDNIMALIRGSATNHDGHSNGLTAPNGLAQEALLRQVLENAAVKPNQIQYVETHGTGTSLGDPIEVSALANVLGQKRTAPLMIGSVKTNLGHLSSAAGIASLIKVVLSLQHAEIPPHLHLTEPNPHIPWDKLPFRVPTELTPWTGEPRLAGVSSFGMSGTNVHVLVEEAPASQPAPIVGRPTHLLTLSGKTEQALADQVSKYIDYFTQHPTVNLADVCYSGNTGRVHFEHRLAVIADDVAELQKKLAAYQQGERVNGLVQGQSEKPKIAFLFTGQGSQDLDMGRELYETQPLFREIMVQCDQILQSYLEIPLLELLYGENKEDNKKLLSQTKYTQPALFAIEYALAKLWQSWGIEPTVVIGHSAGEYAAACVAGVFSLADGLKLIAERGRLVQALPPNGKMVTVRADEKQLSEAIAPYRDQASLAVFNAPQSVVLSGEQEAVNQIVAQIQMEGITWPLNVSHALHSPLMEPMLAEFGEIARTVDYAEPQLKLVSNISGELITDINANYWVEHVRQPVRFAQGMTTLEKMGIDIFIEVGPKITLLILGQQCLSNPFERLWLPSIYPNQRSDWAQMLESLAKLHVRGGQIDWQRFDKPYPRRKLSLPTYPFQRKRYWIDKSPRTQSIGFDRQAITGSALRTDWLYELVWQDAPLPQKSPYADESGHWLIVSEPTSDQAETLAELLRTKGEKVERLAPNTLHAFTNYRGVIYLADQPNNTDIPEKALEISSQVLELVQSLIKAEVKLDLYLVVQDRIEASVLWGLGRTLMWEHPQLNSRCIEAGTTVDALFETIWYADRENQIRLDEKPQRQVIRLEPYQPQSTQELPINRQSSYLITGGLGGIGLKVAEWLVTQGATHLVLSSRRGKAAQSTITALENQGAKVKVVKADVSQAEEVENLLQTSQEFAPLKGIIHAAGVLDDGVVLQQTPARFAKVFAPKVQGSWYLHQYSQGIPLDFFVCFSSQSSLLGNGGQANYASANAFMDALMYQRKKMGLPALAINWGGWSEVGMAKELMAKENEAITPQQGLELLGSLLGQDIPQVGVIPNQWQKFSQKLPSLTGFPVLSKLIKPKSAPSQLTLSQASAEEQDEILKNHIKSEIEQIVGIIPTNEQNFFVDLSMDSLMSIQLTNRLGAYIGISVSVTKILEHPTVSKLSQILLEMLSFKNKSVLQVPEDLTDDDYEEGEL
jgi:acyl transferase domain-containing protein/acyl-CoA synthetase (AMP-forming)/AMP-acid ligase II/acyl carrier protein